MKNSHGYLKLLTFLFSFFALISFFSLNTSKVKAVTNASLKQSQITQYTALSNGDLEVAVKITLTTKSSIPAVVSNYTFPISNADFTNPKLQINGKTSKYSSSISNSLYYVYVVTNNQVVSKTTPLKIVFSYILKSYLRPEGSNIEIALPGKLSNIEDQSLSFNYPNTWENPLKLSNGEYTLKENGSVKSVSITNYSNDNINLVLGKQVVYQYSLSKVLVNDQPEDIVYQISIPRSGYNQKVIFKSVSPQPDNIVIDKSNNTSLIFNVKALQSINLKVDLFVILDDYDHDALNPEIEYLNKQSYWLINDTAVINRFKIYLNTKSIPNTLKDATKNTDREKLYNAVYQYIRDRLTPQKVSNLITDQRLGAENILNSDGNGTPQDYADATISLLRYSGIPAREVLGYIADNGISKGYYHTWVEYWNIDKGTWVAIDPFFDDLNKAIYKTTDFSDRIVFSVRESDPIKPQPQIFSNDEIKVSLFPNITEPLYFLSEEFSNSTLLPFNRYITGSLDLTNYGNSIIKITSVVLRDQTGNEITNYGLKNINLVIPDKSISVPIVIENKYTSVQFVINYVDLNGKTGQLTNTHTINKTIPLWLSIVNYIIYASLIFIVLLVITKLIKKMR
ncbi:MAG TPA: transglutaminase-like domain-containing protein [Candidatus Dojkabacteria bacterium]|nr:transglutaminase-like domain-containing protein [Candidatus Dojkabacteria bacterium]